MARPSRVTQEYISQNEAATLLGCTDRTIRNHIALGRLTGYRLGRTVRLKRAEIEAALVPFGGATS